MLTAMKTDTPIKSVVNLVNPPLIPKGRIGRFVYEQEIGQGSVGIVYLFRDPLIGRKVAIKVLNPQLPADKRQLFEKHFIQEARAAGRLNHPNIVTVYDADKSGDLLFIVMEYLEGKELSTMLSEGHQFSYRQIADLISRIASALDYAHEHGVIHRDIKPANIFISDKGAPKVLDFGIASASRQLSDADATLDYDTLLGRRLLGTPNYMSPEQAKSAAVDARSDIFSLGVVLYQLLCGQLPFKANDIPGLLRAIAHDSVIPPQEIKSDVPLRLARIAAKALSKKPADRYQLASDMARDLNRFVEKERTERIIAKIQQPEQNKAGFSKERRATPPSQLGRRHIGLVLAAILVVSPVLWMALKSLNKSPLAESTQAAEISPNQVAASDTSASIPGAVIAEPQQSIKTEAATISTSMPEESGPSRPTAAENKVDNSTKLSNTKVAAVIRKSEPTVSSTGTVSIAVSPWGEVFVDGHSKGVAPPLTKLKLSLGKHKIEMKNGDENYAVNIEVNAEKEIKLSHRF